VKNLLTRLLTGLVYVAIIMGGLCMNAWAYFFVFCLITGLTLHEFHRLMNGCGEAPAGRLFSLLGGIYLFAASFMYAEGRAEEVIFLPYIFFLILLFVAGMYNKKVTDPIRSLSASLLGQVYCVLPFVLLNLVYTAQDGALFAVALFLFVWANDTGAYLAGSKFGKHRLFERISPKKSWEGFFGGLLLTLAVSQLFAWRYDLLNGYEWLGLAAVVVAFATWGDLTESLFKRSLGVKDSGRLLPGHGGMLDRLDSILMAIPALYIYLKLFIQN